MPVDVINVQKELPKATRNRHSALEDTKEWTYVMTKLTHGLKPNEGLRVVLTKDTLKEVKHAPWLFKKLIQKHLEKLQLDYSVFRLHLNRLNHNHQPIIYLSKLQHHMIVVELVNVTHV